MTRLYPKKYIMGRNIQPGSCAAGQLTEKGYKQHLANGTFSLLFPLLEFAV